MITTSLAPGVTFGPLDPWQAAEFAAAVDKAREHLRPWIPFAATIVDVETARAHLQRYADWHATDSGAFYGIWVDGVLSGGTLFRHFDTHFGVAEVGVWLDPAAEGRGLVNAAVNIMLDYAFRVRGLARVEWYCDPDNVRSRTAAARLGMRLEGTQRQNFVVNGQRRDSEVWAILATEWQAKDSR